MFIRKATPADIPELIKIGRASYAQYYPLMDKEQAGVLEANVSNPDTYTNLLNAGVCFVAEENKDLWGMAFLVLPGHGNEIYDNTWYQIRFVGVMPDSSGKGVGRKLVETCLQQVERGSANVIALHTSEHMHSARHIYESLGFEVVREIERRFGMRYWLLKKNIV